VRHQNRRWRGRARDASAQEMFERALLGEESDSRKPLDPRQDRKTLQLCRQVQRTLMLALAGECGDEVLRDVYVESVEPIGGASELLVRVALSGNASVSAIDVMARLQERSGKLRAEIARAICRKRVPRLSFVAVAMEGGRP
jgi:ribosome-binding factor A